VSDALPWVALGAVLGGIVAVALVVWLVTRFGYLVGEMLRKWLDTTK
jgi:hypothetical protein